MPYLRSHFGSRRMVLEQFGFASRLRDGRQVLGSPGGPFQCDVCLQRFPTRGSLGSHKTYKHGAPEVAPIAVQAADPGALIESLLTPWEGAPVPDADEPADASFEDGAATPAPSRHGYIPPPPAARHPPPPTTTRGDVGRATAGLIPAPRSCASSTCMQVQWHWVRRCGTQMTLQLELTYRM